MTATLKGETKNMDELLTISARTTMALGNRDGTVQIRANIIAEGTEVMFPLGIASQTFRV